MADVNLLSQRSAIEIDATDDVTLNVINSAHFLLKHRVGRVAARIATSGGEVIAFDEFEIQVLFVVGGTWHTLAAAFGTPASDENGFVLHSPDDLKALAHGANGVVIVDASGLWAIRYLSAQAAATDPDVTRTLEVGAEIKF